MGGAEEDEPCLDMAANEPEWVRERYDRRQLLRSGTSIQARLGANPTLV